MITKINDIVLQALALFTRGYRSHHHIREAARLLNTSTRTALTTLDKLEQAGILKAATRGRNKTYAPHTTTTARDHLLLAEHYKKLKFLDHNPLLKEILEQAATHTDGTLAVFGSHAKGTATEHSDLDLLIIGTADEEAIKAVSHTYGVRTDTKTYPASHLHPGTDDTVLRQAIQDHILIKDAEGFIRRAATWTG